MHITTVTEPGGRDEYNSKIISLYYSYIPITKDSKFSSL